MPMLGSDPPSPQPMRIGCEQLPPVVLRPQQVEGCWLPPYAAERELQTALSGCDRQLRVSMLLLHPLLDSLLSDQQPKHHQEQRP